MRKLAGIAFFFLSTSSLCAEDWPQWRGPTRDGHVPAGWRVPESLPAAPKILWRAQLNDGLSSPVISGGKVFILDNSVGKETLHVFDAAGGNRLWSAEIDEAFKDQQSPPGPRCTPLVDGERVYLQSCRGELRCLSAAGKVVWQASYVKDFSAVFIGETGKAEGASRHGNTASPLIDGDRLIAMAGGKDAAVVCFNKADGKVIWKSHNEVPGYAAPIIATLAGTRQLVAYMSGGVIGMSLEDGKVLWRTPVKTSLGRHVTTPVVSGDMVIVGSFQAGLIGIRIEKDVEGLKATQAWAERASAINFASPVIAGGHLYGVGPAKNLICVDVRTGKQAWSEKGVLSGASAHGSLIVMGQRILLLSDGGELTLFEASPEKFKLISRVQVAGANWCNPAYADGKLYLRDGKALYCVAIRD